MRIVLLGANGRTGQLVMRRALEAGHTVTGVVRSSDSLEGVRHEGLEVKVGNVCDPEFLKEVLPGHDAVISTLGPRSPKKSACTIYSDSAAAIAEAMHATGLRRVLVTSTALLYPPSGFFDHVIRLVARNNKEAASSMEDKLRAADLEFTFARTGFLTNGDDSRFVTAIDGELQTGRSISRHALANFLVTELEQSAHIGEAVGLSEMKAV